MAEDQISELRALRAGGADQPVLATVVRAVQATLGVSAGDIDPQARFVDLGGDSLSALSFSRLLADIFGVEVPVGVMVDPTGDLLAVAKHIERHRDSDVPQPTFASVHGADSSEVRADDLTLEKFIPGDLLTGAAELPRPAGEVRTVLLTGATGFLGRFVGLEWLQRLADSGGTLICLARGADAEQARARIEAALSSDAELLVRFRALAEVISRSSTVISANRTSGWTVRTGSGWPSPSTWSCIRRPTSTIYCRTANCSVRMW